MKPAAFEYHIPDSVSEATRLLAELPEAELMAGNQSLGIAMSNRVATPDHIIDINGLTELDYLDIGDKKIEIGAMVRHRDMEKSSALTEAFPILSISAGKIAGPVVRNRGTLGGSIGEADPGGNYPSVLVAMGGEIELLSTDHTRTVDATDYFTADTTDSINENELIKCARFSKKPFPSHRTGMAFLRKKEAAQSWPIVSVASAVRVADPTHQNPVIEEARVGYANASDVPLRLQSVEAAIEGEPISEQTLRTAGERAYDEVQPQSELHADETYKRELACELTKRVFRRSYDRATAEPIVV
ncbi:FAD binding domain-containing protein [Haloquadratum walsbyi]|uniref:Molybdopterin-containing oxidoreductase medium subunit n=1 Tax=Haloquadratum walsbyi (strain DSM 16790 / HBSQ001) TaxID=362976 RepID=Q18IU7_HALWD|nr:xanthine dehydrogenase family protein subunit M [Haloquadratum walsbyi]CAJ52070.1 molybdopterin-containing oxidoreductase medium subunit [Haloquadratum walsbyi DSM 16790]